MRRGFLVEGKIACSEFVANREFHFSGATTSPRTRCIVKLSKCARGGGVQGEGSSSIAKVNAVKRVENSDAQLESLTFVPWQSKALVNAWVEIPVGRADQRVARSRKARKRESHAVQRSRRICEKVR